MGSNPTGWAVMVFEYKSHIQNLAKQLNCQIDIVAPYQKYGMMYPEEEPPRIEVPEIRDQVDYLITLHELGHVFHNHTCGRPPFSNKKFYFDNGVLKSECQAWNWALDRSMLEPTEECRRFIWDVCLGSYYNNGYIESAGKPSRLWNGNRHWVEFVYDTPDSYFDETVKRIQQNLTNFSVEYRGSVDI